MFAITLYCAWFVNVGLSVVGYSAPFLHPRLSRIQIGCLSVQLVLVLRVYVQRDF